MQWYSAMQLGANGLAILEVLGGLVLVFHHVYKLRFILRLNINPIFGAEP